MPELTTPFARQIGAAFAWWRDAGVDCEFGDEAADWLAQVHPAATPAPDSIADTGTREELPSQTPLKPDLLGSAPPQDLAAFRQWWLSEPGLDRVGPRGRIAPLGKAGASLMVLVMDPEAGDSQALLSGAQGRLLDAMLRAMGMTRAEVYLASALPRHTPMVEAETLIAQGMREVLLHHIALAAPQGILAFGAGIPPLLGHDTSLAAAALPEIFHENRSIPLLVAEGLDSLAAMPRLKARFWRRWLEWTEG
ncbi:MAG: hypothetical protein A3J40_08680 [Erythrobacter sp. RIFCSPHIGHO2_12_FULL_63_10]|nr:MAG: hypothetical protein A3J40_08680 [Erythrobacter sp. RIFCSPHIGHO2_12_FULL_63_10]